VTIDISIKMNSGTINFCHDLVPADVPVDLSESSSSCSDSGRHQHKSRLGGRSSSFHHGISVKSDTTNNDPDDDGPSTKSNSSSDNVTRPHDRIREQLMSPVETRKIGRTRWFVILVIMGLGSGLAVGTFRWTSDLERKHMETDYEGTTATISTAVRTAMVHRLGMIASILGTAATVEGLKGTTSTAATATVTTPNWPFVTLPNFHQRAATTRHLSGALFVSIAPLVATSERVRWEEDYAPTNKAWM
jgi:hypothetical protein